jgi:hypothetical protein
MTEPAKVVVHQTSANIIAEFQSERLLLKSPDDILDLMAQSSGINTTCIAVHVKNICPEFFELRTGLAGNILQKLVNYHRKIAVIGDISLYLKSSESLRALVRECNRGTDVRFATSIATLIERGW